ncbi:MAG: hypothetical protein M5U34_40005 [Chloroflexi bacterium]|nr:hypothetical protein [Chloroflexota bacterium]
MPLPVSQVDGVVLQVAADQFFQASVDAVHAILDVGEIQDFIFAKDA